MCVCYRALLFDVSGEGGVDGGEVGEEGAILYLLHLMKREQGGALLEVREGIQLM